ncbi:hypothetical protein DRO58_06980 [Candidatus Bathyarchaeota archaeon]|nr:MAG: hypothetical protein DRO58_06980 [Candidatus Bathyarchaeota archaeon]
MTPRERCLRALTLEEPDRVPLFELGIDAGAEVIIGGAGWTYNHGPSKHTDGNVMSFMDVIVECGVDGFHAIEPQGV